MFFAHHFSFLFFSKYHFGITPLFTLYESYLSTRLVSKNMPVRLLPSLSGNCLHYSWLLFTKEYEREMKLLLAIVVVGRLIVGTSS